MKMPKSFYSWTTAIGAALASVSLFLIVFLFILSWLLGEGGGYSGLFIFMVLPGFLIIGLLMIPIGIYRKLKREKRDKVKRKYKYPVVDFNQPNQRKIVFIFSFSTVVFLLLTAVGGYEAFHLTESNEFCGKLCHSVMEPEYVAYQHSSHAKVACVECHVGAGADWYVRSKLSGLYQVYSVAFNKYPTPIATPIHNLRPARETCEECHWPEKFYSRQLVVKKHYLSDENNTEWDINLQMKTGPEHAGRGLTEGIHWHINPDIRVEYVSTDAKREIISWVKYTNLKTGEELVFQDEGSNLKQEQLDTLEIRTMDCLDCHNRPSHDYKSPMSFVNKAISSGVIPQELPGIKSLALGIMTLDFPSADSAMTYIEVTVNEYYESSYEELFAERKDLIEKAISGLQLEFSRNIFPGMKVNWKAYPNQIGHLEFNGCFRCHDDQHKDDKGQIISMDCNLCHTIIGQGVPDTLQVANYNSSLEFVHPNDPDQYWKEMLCVDCHGDMY